MRKVLQIALLAGAVAAVSGFAVYAQAIIAPARPVHSFNFNPDKGGDSAISGGWVSQSSSNVVSIDACLIDRALPGCDGYCDANPGACAPVGGGGSGGGSPGQFSASGRCVFSIQTPSGLTIQTAGMAFGNGFCTEQNLVMVGATSGTARILYETGDSDFWTGGAYFAQFSKTKSTDWTYEWTGCNSTFQRCSSSILWNLGIGTHAQEPVSVVMTHKTTGERHQINYNVDLRICGTRVGTSRAGCA